ncbi:MAG: type II toxin-antitoxin system VapC family toxin [Pseudomonadota bacterium]
MIILDTNIVSEFMGSPPDHKVLNWLKQRAPHELFYTSVSISETVYGLERLPEGVRRASLTRDFETFVSKVIGDNILELDRPAAEATGAIRAERRELGLPIGVADAMIAGIARTRDLAIATRNTSDFDGIRLTLINPFEHSG